MKALTYFTEVIDIIVPQKGEVGEMVVGCYDRLSGYYAILN